MGKRKVCSGNVLVERVDNVVQYTTQNSTTTVQSRSTSIYGLHDFKSTTSAFGFNGRRTIKGKKRIRNGGDRHCNGRYGGGMDELDELLGIVGWNSDEDEYDFTPSMNEDDDSDSDDDLAYIKANVERENTLKVPSYKSKMERAKTIQSRISVSNLRFDSLLRIGCTAESIVKSPKESVTSRIAERNEEIMMEKAFAGDMWDDESSTLSSLSSSISSRSSSKTTLIHNDDDNDEFRTDVEF